MHGLLINIIYTVTLKSTISGSKSDIPHMLIGFSEMGLPTTAEEISTYIDNM